MSLTRIDAMGELPCLLSDIGVQQKTTLIDALWNEYCSSDCIASSSLPRYTLITLVLLTVDQLSISPARAVAGAAAAMLLLRL